MKRSYFILVFALLTTPLSLYAASLSFGSLIELADTLAGGVVKSLGYLLFTLAVVAFFWGMVQFIWNARQGNSGKGMENGKQFMLWGLIALFVMFSVWGIIQWAQSVLDIRGQTSIVIPRIQLLGAPTGAVGAGGRDLGQAACPAGEVRNSAGTCVKTDASCVSKPVDAECTGTYAGGGTFQGWCNSLKQCATGRSSFGRCILPKVQKQGGVAGDCVTPGSSCTEEVTSNGQSTSITGTYNDNGACVAGGTQECSGMTEVQRTSCFKALPTCNNIANEGSRSACLAAKASACESPEVPKQGGGGCVTPGSACTEEVTSNGQSTSVTGRYGPTGTCMISPSGVGGPCNEGRDCASGLTCNPANNTCR